MFYLYQRYVHGQYQWPKTEQVNFLLLLFEIC